MTSGIDLYSLISLSLLALLWLLLSIWQLRQSYVATNRRWFRILLITQIFAAIALLLIQPKRQVNPVTRVKLVTVSAVSDPGEVAKSNLNSEDNSTPVFYYAPNKSLIDYWQRSLSISKQQIISHPQELSMRFPALSEVQLLGDGLLTPEWQGMDNIQLKYENKVPPLGIISPRWNQQITLGQDLVIGATVNAGDNQLLEVKLLSAKGKLLAEKTIRSKDKFILKYRPQHRGSHHNILQIKDARSNILWKESVRYFVDDGQSVNIAAWSIGVEPELKYLRKWAGAAGARLVWQQQVSDNKFLIQLENADKENLAQNKNEQKIRFEKSFLEKQDLFILNARSLISLNKKDQKELVAAVQNGLGLLILSNNQLARNLNKLTQELKLLFSTKSQVSSTSDNKPHAYRLTDNKEKNKGWSQDYQIYAWTPIFAFNADQTLLKSGSKQPLIQLKQLGKGRVSLSWISHLYQLQLSGFSERYQSIWQRIIEQTARPAHSPFIIRERSITDPKNDYGMRSFYPAHIKTRQCVHYNTPEYKSTGRNRLSLTLFNQAGKTDLWLNPDQHNKDTYCATFWPAIGWNQLVLNVLNNEPGTESGIEHGNEERRQKDQYTFYAWPVTSLAQSYSSEKDKDQSPTKHLPEDIQDHSWSSAFRAKKQEDTIKLSRQLQKRSNSDRYTELQPVPEWWFLLLLIFACSVLWFEEKFASLSIKQ